MKDCDDETGGTTNEAAINCTECIRVQNEVIEELKSNKALITSQNTQIETLKIELDKAKRSSHLWQIAYEDVGRKLEISKTNVIILLKTARSEIEKYEETITKHEVEIDNLKTKITQESTE